MLFRRASACRYIADTIHEDAKSISVKTDDFLEDFRSQYNFTLMGEEHKLKTRESIRRKLIASAVKLFAKNESSPNYSLDLVRLQLAVTRRLD